MIQIARTDRSLLGRWWWTVDRWSLAAFFILSLFGVFLVTAASPPVAERIGLGPFHFVYRHLLFLVPALTALVTVSMLSRKSVWRLATIMLAGASFLTLCTVFFGAEIKGATRWLHLFGFSLQPSEFIKPAFAVTSAWLLTRRHHEDGFPGFRLSAALFALMIFLLMLQPDLGMSFVMATIWGVQIFLAGLPLVLVIALGCAGIAGIAGAYMFFPHVSSRIDRFLDPSTGDTYQVEKSLEAFGKGGLFGTGPAAGNVKLTLPDAHADFIFAVAGEELGLIAALLIVGVFVFILLRSVGRVLASNDLFVITAVGGIATQLAVQSLIHMGSSLQLLPAKGMTLPFISYGGSSLLSLGIGCGMLLALTRRGRNGGSLFVTKDRESPRVSVTLKEWAQEEPGG